MIRKNRSREPEMDMPTAVEDRVNEFVSAARDALGDQLVSAVLFGSAAEGKLRATSDVNIILVLARFDAARIDALREPLRGAHALIRLECMFILESEVDPASEAFAVKFYDIRERHKVLWGRDLFAALAPSRNAMRTRLRQILLNFILRTRERYALTSLREEQLVPLIADAAGPLRSAAALMLELAGQPAGSPKEALEKLANEIDRGRFEAALAHLSRAREAAALPAGVARETTLALIDLAQALHERAREL
jgi:predicted nucleotidyltransferase